MGKSSLGQMDSNSVVGTVGENPPWLLLAEDQPFKRHPGDLIRLVFGATVLLVLSLAASQAGLATLEVDIFRLLNHLPEAISVPLQVIMQAGSLVAVPVAAGLALLLRRSRLARDLATSGVIAWLLADLVKILVGRERPIALLAGVTIHGAAPTGLGFPSGHVAVASALATAAGPYLSTKGRRATWGIVWLVALARVYVGAHLPIDVVGGAALGWAVGAAVHLLWGSPGGYPSRETVRQALTDAGLNLLEIHQARVDARGSAPFIVRRADGVQVFVKAVGREQRTADWLFKAWRFLVFREVEDEVPFATPKQQIEHEAYLALLAERAGVRTPSLIFATQMGDGTALLVQQQVMGRGLDSLARGEVDDALLRRIWAQVSLLRKARIAHRDLRRANILVDEQGQPWVVDFGFAEAAASDQRLALDVAEMLASLACLVGAERAVRTAIEELGQEALATALPLLQPLALSSVTRHELRVHPGLVREIRDQVAKSTGLTLLPERPLTRVQLHHVLWLLGGAFAIHVLLPQVGEIRQTLITLGHVQWGWLFVGVLGSASTYLMAAIGQIGAVDRPLALGRTIVAQFAASFANRLSPQGLGGMALIERYLERAGVERPAAVAAITLSMASGALVHSLALILTVALVGTSGLGKLPSLPRSWPVLVAVAGVMALLGVILLSPPGRRRLVVPVADAARSLAHVLRRPGQAVRVFGGAAGVTLFDLLTLVVSLYAFGSDASLLKVIAVYLGGMAIGSASPTPGGLGTVEAALVAGLMAVGVQTELAVAGVLTFRLLTFWLPIIPGFVALRFLQRRQML